LRAGHTGYVEPHRGIVKKGINSEMCDIGQRFIAILLEALEHVAPVYYSAYLGFEADLPYLHTLDETALEYLKKHHERVFCYELYHQIRVLMDANPSAFQGVRFQGELRKIDLGPILPELLGVGPLDREFVPDFLLHGAGDVDHQEVVMEVKCESDLSPFAAKKDLAKIQHFMTQLHYKAGFFLTVNASPQSVHRFCENPAHQEWVSRTLPDRERIYWVWKEHPWTKPYLWPLGPDALPLILERL
jgi:hypothetical protein